MKQRILSMTLTLCLCLSLVPAARAREAAPPGREVPEASGLVRYAGENVPTPQEVYDILIAFENKEDHKEGDPWTDDNKKYEWHGGNDGGTLPTMGTGCAAFAYELSDAAFGTLSARMVTPFSLSDVKVGDILRVEGDSHSVIVLQVSGAGVVVAEGNYNGTVHWGRALSKEYVETANYLVTRYPEWYNPSVDPDAPIEGADGTTAEGTFGGLSWKVTNNGTLTISGSGAMPEVDINDLPWKNYASRILDIDIRSGVESVASSAFQGSGALSVTIPSSVKSIGDSAFRSCANLVSVTIPEGVESIGGNAFRACTALTSVTLPASVIEVGAAAFLECTELTEATFKPGSAMVSMGDNLFSRCYKLSKVTLPQKADCISTGMFQNCSFLTSVAIPEGAAIIEGQAFASCGGLKQISIPKSVTAIRTGAFDASGLTDIYYSGTEAEWNAVTKDRDVVTFLANVTVHYNEQMPGTPDTPSTPDTPGTPDTPDTPEAPDQPSVPSGHVHSWALAWSSDSSYHWHECTAGGCTVSANSEKSGYGAHSFGSWVVDKSATSSQSGSRHRTCTVCGYIQTDTIPSTGSDRDDSSSSSNSSASSSSPVTTTTTRNPDGSTTTTKTDSRTGTVTETTKNPDGSQTVVETQKDGTVTTLETDRTGNRTETVVKPDGSSTVLVEQTNGSTATVSTSASGRTEAEVRLSSSVVSAARQSGEAIPLPIPEVRAARSTESAATVTVRTRSEEPVKVTIPAASPTPGTVAVAVYADGTELVIKDSVPVADGVTVSLSDGAAVKIVDNSRNFADITSQYWAADAIDFVSARELFSGTTETTFTPDAPMTRAMLMVVLARFDGTDTAGGATWYEKGMEWAVALGISDGSRPDQSITREQLITMLWRYAGAPAASGTQFNFEDAGQISAYAQEALRWAVENGIISGFSDGQVKPQGQATRAQVAQMLRNFIEKQV